MSDLNWEESIAQWTDDIIQLESLLDGEETSEIQSARDQLVDIRIGLEKMSDVDGVSRGIAMSLESYLPDDINFKTFTRLPTHTNYDQTVISLEEKNWGLIAMIGVAIAGLITKIIMWLFDRKGGGDKNHSKVVEQNDKVVESAKDLTQKVDKPTRADVEKTINDKYNAKWNAYTEMCCVNPTEQVKAFFALEDDLYVGRMSLLELANEHLKNVRGAKSLPNIDTRFSSNVDTMVRRFSGKLSVRGETVEEVFASFQTELESLKNQSPSNPFNIEEFIKSEGIAKYVNDSRDIDINSVSGKTMEKDLKSLKKTTDDLVDDFKSKQQSGATEGARNLASAQEKELTAVSTLIRGLIKYIVVRENLIKDSKAFYKANEEYEKELKRL